MTFFHKLIFAVANVCVCVCACERGHHVYHRVLLQRQNRINAFDCQTKGCHDAGLQCH